MLGCSQYAVDGKCSLPNSYINLFYRKFWKDIYQEWWQTDQKAQDTVTSEEYWNVMEPFYDDHREMFLNSYAATNVEEDIAESFSYFVLNARPTGNAVVEQKAAFFYEFPELAEYRRQIIEELCAYVK